MKLETALADKEGECQRLAEQTSKAKDAAQKPPPALSAVQLTELGVELQSQVMRLELLAKQHGPRSAARPLG